MAEKQSETWEHGQRTDRPGENEQIIEMELERLRDFHDHPFRIKEDAEMRDLVESIERFGILSPLIVRPRLEGTYEIVSGHRRKYAAGILGYRKVPVIIRVMDDDDAVISMVDANIRRETILPSEKADAIKMKYDAMKRSSGKRKRGQHDSRPKGMRTVQILGKETGDSAEQIQRYLKLVDLIPELRDMLDTKRISFNPAYEMAFLSEEDQKKVVQAISEAGSSPSLSQAQRIKNMGLERGLTVRAVKDILSEVKKGDIYRVIFKNEQLYQFFPRNYPPRKMKQEILNILAKYKEQNGKIAKNWIIHFPEENTATGSDEWNDMGQNEEETVNNNNRQGGERTNV